MFVAGLGEIHRALLLVDVVVLAKKLGNQRVHADIEAGPILRRAGDDQRRPRLVHQDGIDLVDDGEFVPALHHLRDVVFHVVAQVVEAEFVVGAVGDVGGVGSTPLVVVETVHDVADAHPEEAVDLSHPLGVAAGEIIIDGDDVDALAGERVQIHREGGDERLAFAGAHLGDGALVQHHSADQLDVEMPLLERSFGGLAHRGEGGNEQVVQGLAGRELRAERLRLAAQLLVVERFEFGLQRIDRRDFRTIALEAPVIRSAEHFFESRAEHFRPFRCRVKPVGAAHGRRADSPEPTAPERSRTPRRKSNGAKDEATRSPATPWGRPSECGAEIGRATPLVNKIAWSFEDAKVTPWLARARPRSGPIMASARTVKSKQCSVNASPRSSKQPSGRIERSHPASCRLEAAVRRRTPDCGNANFFRSVNQVDTNRILQN